MANLNRQTARHQKERMRAEIDRQITEFLDRGGKIDVVTGEQQKPASVGSVWHQQDETARFAP